MVGCDRFVSVAAYITKKVALAMDFHISCALPCSNNIMPLLYLFNQCVKVKREAGTWVAGSDEIYNVDRIKL